MKALFCLIGCALFSAALLLCPREVVRGTMLGGTLCIEVLLPSLFPFMILSSFLARSGAGELLARPFLPATRLLRLPDATAPVLLTSMIGGYPTGAQAILSFLDAGRLQKREAERLLLCAVNAGPAFVVVAVGERMFGSAALGWRLLGCQMISSIALCLFFCRGIKSAGGSAPPRSNPPLSRVLVESVSQATGGILSIASYVLLVSVLLELIRPLPLAPALRVGLTGLLEVTTGCKEAAALGGITGALLAAFFLAFGGLSVGFQVLSLLISSGISTRHFFSARLLGGLFCAILLCFFLPALPEPAACASAALCSPTLLPAANSPNRLLGALCMMAMSVQLFSRIDRCAAWDS